MQIYIKQNGVGVESLEGREYWNVFGMYLLT